MPINSEAVAEQEKNREESFNALGWCLAGTMGIALMCGLGKMAADLKKTQSGVPRRKRPWELD